MLTPAAQAQIDRRRQERQERIDGDRPLFDTALTIGDMALADVGCEVYARTEGDISNVRMRADGEARGGIIVEVTDTVEADIVTGEIGRLRAFRCFDYQQKDLAKAFTVLTEAQANPDSFTVARVDRVRGVYRRLCADVGARRGTATAREIDLVVIASRLAAVVGQRGHR